ncbi:MAG: hypothetical protein V7L20_17830 [Nostoc sp.]|uniref:WD40 repeat domain-containing protein n=1 Tax=Nostoc sp. TaxID=1180 RepID=UPI002FF5FF9E
MFNILSLGKFKKVTTSFFVGASIGILSPIIFTSSRALAASSQIGIPTGAATALQTLANQGITPKTIAFAPNAGWVILNGNNGWNSENIPQEATKLLSTLTLNKQNSTINTIAFTRSGEWVIIYDGNAFSWSTNFPKDVVNQLKTLNQNKSTINTVAFTPNGQWIILSNGGNTANWSTNFPKDAVNEIKAIYKIYPYIKTIAFTPNGAWVIFYANGYGNTGYAYSSGISQLATSTIVNDSKAGYRLINIAFTPSNGWALLDLSPQEIQLQNLEIQQEIELDQIQGEAFKNRAAATLNEI